MNKKEISNLKKWRENYAALIVAMSCLYSAVESWGDNWFMAALLSAGVIICGTIAFFDIKRILNLKKLKCNI
ncbi:hypothetical protein ACTHOQ_14835 [Solibacillus silvestris]|uniref:hypothetical protein n=1 Tax=Solibacillus silvestris TaxID=76853 RepID=UPI003F7FB6DB